MSSDSTYPVFPVFSFLGFIVVLLPLPWHLRAWNSGTCYFMLWTAVACLNTFINSVVWAGNVRNSAPVWCDISTRIVISSSVGVPAASLCVNRRLFGIARLQAVCVTVAEKRRAILIDTLLCVLLPLVVVALSIIVQGHRFNLFEDVGCFAALYNTPLTYTLVYSWPVLLGLASLVFSSLSIARFARRRAEISEFVSKQSPFTPSRYMRLIALSMIAILFTTPLAIFVIVLNLTSTRISPWISWEDTHFDFWRIEQVPAVIWRSDHMIATAFELSRWLSPLCAFVFFAFFGFAEESRRHYNFATKWFARKLGFDRWLERHPALRLPSVRLRKSAASSMPTYAIPPSVKVAQDKFSRPSTSTFVPDKAYNIRLSSLYGPSSPVYSSSANTSDNASLSKLTVCPSPVVDRPAPEYPEHILPGVRSGWSSTSRPLSYPFDEFILQCP